MFLRKLAPFLLVFIFVAAVSANAAPLGKDDYVVTYIPTGDTLEIKKTLNFTPADVQVYMERYYPTKSDYIAGLTVYSKDYATSRGVSVGDPVEKVKERYGEPSRPSGTKSHYKWLSYVDQQQILKVHFYLDKKTERVIAINFNIYPVSKPPMIKMADGEYH
jgi:hypothetical protein